jgi:hypothetical protein
MRRGSLYLRPLSYCQALETDEAGRSDPYEGVQGIFQPDRIQVFIDIRGQRHELGDLAGPIIITSKGLTDVHAFCLYAITLGDYEVEDQECEGGGFKVMFDPSFESFGGYVLVARAGAFVKRVKEALEKRGKRARCDLVKYVKESEFHGDLPEDRTSFYKFDKFKHQQEYRIVVYNSGSPNEPIRLDVGDLSDIVDIVKFDELDVKLRKNH